MADDTVFSKFIYEDEAKSFRWLLTVSEFRGVQYLGIRKHFLSFEEEWLPTKDGATIPLNLSSTLRLFLGLSELLSEVEKSQISEELQSIIKEYDEFTSRIPRDSE